MNGKKRLGWLALALCTLGTLVLTALPGRPAAIPALSQDPLPLLVRTSAILVDGTPIRDARMSPDGSRSYAPAEDFLAALDRDFWAGETLEYSVLSFQGRDWLWVEDFCRRHGIAAPTRKARAVPLWCTSAAGNWAVPDGIRAPVLMYHGVGDDIWTAPELFVRSEDLSSSSSGCWSGATPPSGFPISSTPTESESRYCYA